MLFLSIHTDRNCSRRFFYRWTRAKELVTDKTNENKYFEEENQTIAYQGYDVQPTRGKYAGLRLINQLNAKVF